MTTAEAIQAAEERLRAKSPEAPDSEPLVTTWQVRGMISRGEIPKPRINSALQFDWNEADLDALCRAIESKLTTTSA